MGKGLSTLGAVVLGVVIVDQLTKLVVVRQLSLGESIPVIPGFFHLTLVRNTGMAFGLLSGSNIPFKSLIVTVLSVAAMVAVTYYALRAPSNEKWTRVGLMFILGGAFGNIIDRLRLGYVIDFVDIFYRDAHWPAFNVADSSICIGVGLLLIDSLRRPEPAIAEAAGVGRGES